MSGRRTPDWFDRRGMLAWAEGMSAAIRRQVRVVTTGGDELLSAGNGDGEATVFPLDVNGQPVGRLELRPALANEALHLQVDKAIETFRSLAEVRNSMADLVRTTANQWRELSLLYRSSDLLRVDQGQDTLASALLEQAVRAVRGRGGVVRYGSPAGTPITVTAGDGHDALDALAEWGAGLAEAVIVSEAKELRRLGFDGEPPDQPSMVVPLKCRDRRFGALVLVGREDRRPSSEDLKLASLLADQAGRAFDNLQLVARARDAERLKRELELASEIQSSILPPAEQITDWFDFAGACVPAKWVGGDAFLLHRQESGTVVAGVADVCGHGVSSALLMNAFASSIDALSTTMDEPGRLLELTNDLLAERVDVTGLFVTVILLRLTADGELTVASAGHPPAMIVSPSGEVDEIDCGDLPLGIMPGSEYREVRRSVAPGAVVVAYSDGVTEARSPDGEMFGAERLRELLGTAGAAESGSQAVRAAVLAGVERFREGCEQEDDVTVVALRRTE